MSHVVTLGETMGLIRADESGHVGSRSRMSAGFGGAESNFAVAMTRLGHDATWVSRLGDDEFGRMITHELRGERVQLAVTHADAPTGLMIKFSQLPGRQSVAYYRAGSAASTLAPEDLPAETIREADLLHITGITLAISESARKTAFAAVEIAREAGTTVSFDVNHRARLWNAETAIPVYRHMAELADIVFAGREEASLLADLEANSDPEELLRALSGLGIKHPVLKEGTEGAWGLFNGNMLHADAVPVNAVDTVGAGDGFAAGFLSAFLKNESQADCLENGALVGAFACLTYGDWEGYPTVDDLKLLDDSEHVSR